MHANVLNCRLAAFCKSHYNSKKQLIENLKHLHVYYKLNKNTWGVKKVRGQEEPATKSSDIT